MTREDIIRMAREAGFKVGENLSGEILVGVPSDYGLAHFTVEDLERFAALVAAAEREACAKVCDARVIGDHNREDQEAKRCAAAIRARGEA